MSDKLVMVEWMFSSIHFIEFTIQNITIGETAFIYLKENCLPSLLFAYTVVSTVLDTELVSLYYIPHSVVVIIN